MKQQQGEALYELVTWLKDDQVDRRLQDSFQEAEGNDGV